jgi:Flp pilus assembly protein TadG
MKMTAVRVLNRRRLGQALPEFALVLPLILLILFGAIELGRAVYIYNTLANAARQGARVAAVNQKEGSGQCNPLDRSSWSITDCVLDAGIAINLTAGNITVQYVGTSCAARSLAPPCIARVTVNYAYVPFTPIVSDLIGSIGMSSTSEMPVEAWYP